MISIDHDHRPDGPRRFPVWPAPLGNRTGQASSVTRPPMEIEAIYGALLRLARMAGVETPALDLFVTLARLRAEEAGLVRVDPL